MRHDNSERSAMYIYIYNIYNNNNIVYNVQLTLLTLLKMLDFRDFNPTAIFHINVRTFM